MYTYWFSYSVKVVSYNESVNVSNLRQCLISSWLQFNFLTVWQSCSCSSVSRAQFNRSAFLILASRARIKTFFIHGIVVKVATKVKNFQLGLIPPTVLSALQVISTSDVRIDIPTRGHTQLLTLQTFNWHEIILLINYLAKEIFNRDLLSSLSRQPWHNYADT